MAVPIALTGRVFYWNKTTFDEIGCPIPTDKDSLLAAGAAFQAYGEDYYPLAMNELDRTIFLVYYLESVYESPGSRTESCSTAQRRSRKALTSSPSLRTHM